jgi:uncharacterized protein (DUF2336 family)
LIAGSDEPLQASIASRFGIGETVGEKLAELDAEAVLLALLGNVSASISEMAFDLIAQKSRRIPSLREPLARRLALHAASGNVSPLPERTRAAAPPDGANEILPMSGAARDSEADGADRLVTKLASSGQLRAGFLLRVLQQGQLGLFDAGLARLLDLPLARSREQFYEGGPAAVALACRAVGIDRCVFSTVYTLSRRSRGMAPELTQSETRSVEEVFRKHSKPAALALLRAA